MIGKAKTSKFEVAGNLNPIRDWLSFGIILTANVVYFLAAWKYGRGDKPSVTKKSVNFSFDVRYMPYIAIADGILSSDKEQLKLAWALWPEKRESIYYYDQAKHEPEVFEPGWEL